MKSFKEFLVESSQPEWRVEHKDGIYTVKARTEKEAIRRAAKQMGSLIAADRPQDFKVTKRG